MICEFAAGPCDIMRSYTCSGKGAPWAKASFAQITPTCRACPADLASLGDSCMGGQHCTVLDPNACAGHVLARCESGWQVDAQFYCNPASCPGAPPTTQPDCATEGEQCAYPVETACGTQDAVWRCEEGNLVPVVVPLCVE